MVICAPSALTIAMDNSHHTHSHPPKPQRGRKRKYGNEDERLVMLERRKEQNRLSASQSRTRRKQEISELEAQAALLEKQKEALLIEISNLRAQNAQLKLFDVQETRNNIKEEEGVGEKNQDGLEVFDINALLNSAESSGERLFDSLMWGVSGEEMWDMGLLGWEPAVPDLNETSLLTLDGSSTSPRADWDWLN